MESEYIKTIADLKYKVKEHKLTVDELKLKIKHYENRIS
jgi:hypothetical protein